MEVLKITPRGYCYGVVDAMVIAKRAAEDKRLPRPIYILGMIVHNQHVVDAFAREGVITVDGEDRLQLLEKVDSGTVIFTAHGVSPEVKRRAQEKGLRVIDATCPDVNRTHELIREKTALGYEIVYIGRRGHPEPEGAMGVAPGHVHLVESAADVDGLQLATDKIVVTNQTTMSQWDTRELTELVVQKYPTAEVHNEICLATQTRQQAVAEQAGSADVCIVVGDPRSNNSNRLAQVAEEIAGVKAYRVADVTEIRPEWLMQAKRVAVTSGASTPTAVTKEVVDFLERFDPADESTHTPVRTLRPDKILPTLRSTATHGAGGRS
ncbi:4-hydroxy-3-methylbut-2-enyl diphosphate reductase [Alicyclobacillus hesperidum subsp. aegles]|uniref:4-hydroxy-3-methylbut-2-enyl diphosphate reductase n=1 Tax=Alicyclobacillus hesperidum TaxID=89784 RepID=UPI0007192177|nr:4-hydroxy-3-methylbut-2-enyl diphosphate reductase [Alicyclobacillus hesperidum]KRW92539.1 4-hydroxy-3-methylbut-2-enyl diphosphate reductase [Alicyclobacillus tengchongensis]GLG00046.1 4-hydroxy-3-methylbut-2-enyl diphosphate reductase [Alicyclobacillus hesperidum subsp. aegles]